MWQGCPGKAVPLLVLVFPLLFGFSHSLHGIMSWHCHFCWVFPTPYTGIFSGFYHSLHGIPPNNMRYYGPHSCLLWWRRYLTVSVSHVSSTSYWTLILLFMSEHTCRTWRHAAASADIAVVMCGRITRGRRWLTDISSAIAEHLPHRLLPQWNSW